MNTMLLDRQGRPLDIDLLDHPGHVQEWGKQLMPAAGAKVDVMIEESRVDGFGRKRFTFVLGVSWLATNGTPVLAFRDRWLGRLDDVGGRGFGGRRRILACRGKLFLQLQDDGLKSLDSRFLSVELLLQTPAIRAARLGFGSHSTILY